MSLWRNDTFLLSFHRYRFVPLPTPAPAPPYPRMKVLNAERKQAAEERGNQEPEQWEFVHPWVQRGRQENLIHVKRKAEGDRGRKRPPPEEMTAVMSEMNMLKQHNMELASRLQIVEKQNQALWDGLHDERKRAATQQKKIEKIMVFLSAHFQGHGHEVEAGGAKRDALETGASPGAVSMRKRAKLKPADGAEDGDSEVANAAAQAAAAAFPNFMKMPSASGGAGGGGGSGSSSGGSAPTLSHVDVLAGIFNPSPASSTPSPQSEQVNEAVGGVLQNFESRINLTKARLSDHMDDDLLAGIFHLPDTPQGGSNGGGGGVATAAAAGGGGGGGSIQSGSASAAAMAAPARRVSSRDGRVEGVGSAKATAIVSEFCNC